MFAILPAGSSSRWTIMRRCNVRNCHVNAHHGSPPRQRRRPRVFFASQRERRNPRRLSSCVVARWRAILRDICPRTWMCAIAARTVFGWSVRGFRIELLFVTVWHVFLNTSFSFIVISHHLFPDFSRFLLRLVVHRDVGNRSFLVCYPWFVPINPDVVADRLRWAVGLMWRVG